MDQPTAALVIIGNEVLSGKVADENAPFIIKELRALGVRLARISFIEDGMDDIATEVRRCSDAYDWVFTTGGLGPTHDDLTMEAIAQAFDTELVQSPELVVALESIRHGRPMESLQRLSWIPDGAELFWGEHGTSRWPTVHMGNVYIFPGVPSFLRGKFGELRALLRTTPVLTATVHLSRSESDLVDAINATVEAFTDVEIGSYPQFGDVDHKTRITFDHTDPQRVEAAKRHLLDAVDPADLVRIIDPGV